jgi:3' terminal RNA ribose 2'-O-methyltransferase Hen1
MILKISTTHEPASDLGYLLHKHPGRVHSAELPYGQATVFFAEATDQRCTAVLSLHVDSVGMVRGKAEHGRWDQYVNDRPYASSSFLSTAMTEFFGTAMSGRCKERPELAATAIPLEFHLPVVRCRGGDGFVRRLFEPLGYVVDVERIEPYYSVRLSITGTLHASLAHLYVLIPVMDDDKHYWVDMGEIDKLLRRGGDWLANHPEREEVARRYLLRERTLIREALARLDADEVEVIEERPRVTLHDIRLDAVA